MKVRELLTILADMPLDSEVRIYMTSNTGDVSQPLDHYKVTDKGDIRFFASSHLWEYDWNVDKEE